MPSVGLKLFSLKHCKKDKSSSQAVSFLAPCTFLWTENPAALFDEDTLQHGVFPAGGHVLGGERLVYIPQRASSSLRDCSGKLQL